MNFESAGILRIARRDFSDDYLTGNIPVIITDGIADWPALTRWAPDRLGDLVHGAVVNLQVSFNGAFKFNPDGTAVDPGNQIVLKNVPFSRAVSEIVTSNPSGAKYYISQQSITHKLPGLLSDLNCWWSTETAETNLWFGSAGVISPLHIDRSANLFAQVHGTKKFTVFSPEETPHLYPYPENNSMSHLSHVDVSHPNLLTHPEYATATPQVFTIFPGQMLFLPPFWWHHVESLSVSISINQWRPPMLTQCIGLMALRTLRAAYKRDRWQAYRNNAGLSPFDLIKVGEGMLDINPGVALLAIAVALDCWDSENGHSDKYLPDSNLRSQFDVLLAQLVDAADEKELPRFADLHFIAQNLLRSLETADSIEEI